MIGCPLVELFGRALLPHAKIVTAPQLFLPPGHDASWSPATRRLSSVIGAWMSNSDAPPKIGGTPWPGSVGSHVEHSVFAAVSVIAALQSPPGDTNCSLLSAPPQAPLPPIGT